jgi:hypothetical protein
MPASRRVPVGFALLLAVAASSPVRDQDRRPPGDSSAYAVEHYKAGACCPKSIFCEPSP